MWNIIIIPTNILFSCTRETSRRSCYPTSRHGICRIWSARIGEASNPLDEGSLFKYKNLDQPIAAKNQYSSKIPMIDVTSKISLILYQIRIGMNGGGEIRSGWNNKSACK